MDERKINLQLFAEPAEDDDVNIVDETPQEEIEVNDDDVDLENIKGLFITEDEEENQEANDEVEESEKMEEKDVATEEENKEVAKEETEAKQEEQQKQEVKYFTQEDLDRIIQERLARDRKSKLVRELEELTGTQLEEIVNYARQHKIQQKAEELGITEEEARALIEKEEKLKEMEAQLNAYKQETEAIRRTIKYGQDKLKFINNPLVKKYEKEIDDFAQGGLMLDFEPAMYYVLGTKVANGELLQNLQEGAEKKALANITKKNKANVEKVGNIAPTTESVPPYLKNILNGLGISVKEYLAEKEKIQKQYKR